MVERRTPEREVQGSNPRPPCSVLEQDTLSSPKYWYISRNQWFRPNMTGKLFTGTLNNSQIPSHSDGQTDAGFTIAHLFSLRLKCANDSYK